MWVISAKIAVWIFIQYSTLRATYVNVETMSLWQFAQPENLEYILNFPLGNENLHKENLTVTFGKSGTPHNCS